MKRILYTKLLRRGCKTQDQLHFIIGMFPGSFPSRLTEQAETPISDDSLASIALGISETEIGIAFEAKTRYVSVHDLIAQLNSIVYLMVGYQVIKICHLACVLPVVLHCAYNTMVLPSMADGSASKVVMLRRWLSPNEQALGAGSGAVTAALTPNAQVLAGEASLFQLMRALLLWKTIVSIVAHALFVMMWEVILARANKLELVRNGAWWFISFIGEPTPNIDFSHLTTIEIAVHLGFLQLLASDIAILCVQLVLLQLIYGQSNILVDHDHDNDQGDVKYLVPMRINTSANHKSKSRRRILSSESNPESESLLARNIITIKLYECF